jgi:hypothetical protein
VFPAVVRIGRNEYVCCSGVSVNCELYITILLKMEMSRKFMLLSVSVSSVNISVEEMLYVDGGFIVHY